MINKLYAVSVTILLSIFIMTPSYGQESGFFFVEDVYQRSYLNPAILDSGKIGLASGFGADFSTNGPGISDFLKKGPEGNLLISASDAIDNMNVVNDIYGNTALHTIDLFYDTSFGKFSFGHAWKASGWFSYTKDLASFVTFGNAGFIGETIQLAPQFDYINYNELYLGYQKKIGIVSVGARIKKLNGVESINSEGGSIELTTSDDIYQLTLASDYTLNTTQAFSYQSLDDFNVNLQSFSFDNFLSKNNGWAFDMGVRLDLGNLELSAAIVDLGSITWDNEASTYTSSTISTFEGIDVEEFINTEEGFVLLDSLESLLDISSTVTSYTTSLPAQVNIGARYQLNDKWILGGFVQSRGKGDKNALVVAVNATTKINDMISIGATYSVKNKNVFNLGLNASLNIGPVIGFITTDNILQLGSFSQNNSTLRAGLSMLLGS